MAKKDDSAPSEIAPPRDPRRIRIVNDGDLGNKARIFDDTGRDITRELMVEAIEIRMKVGEINKATLHVLAIHGDVSAEVEAIERAIIPPPMPTEQVKVFIGEPVRRWFGLYGSRYRVERHVPVHRFPPGTTNAEMDEVRDKTLDGSGEWGGGAIVTTLAKGWTAPIGPLEFSRPA